MRGESVAIDHARSLPTATRASIDAWRSRRAPSAPGSPQRRRARARAAMRRRRWPAPADARTLLDRRRPVPRTSSLGEASRTHSTSVTNGRPRVSAFPSCRRRRPGWRAARSRCAPPLMSTPRPPRRGRARRRSAPASTSTSAHGQAMIKQRQRRVERSRRTQSPANTAGRAARRAPQRRCTIGRVHDERSASTQRSVGPCAPAHRRRAARSWRASCRRVVADATTSSPCALIVLAKTT